MTLSVKDGVKIDKLDERYVIALPLIYRTFEDHIPGMPVVITSGADGDHMEGSKHYTVPLKALDWRTWVDDRGTQLSTERKWELVSSLRNVLPRCFQFEVEGTHIHIEIDD
jgi:hypothetical protein